MASKSLSELRENPLVRVLTTEMVNAVSRAASKPDNNLPTSAVQSPKTRDDIEREILVSVQQTPELQVVTNSEPWYTKRTFWSATISMLFVVLAPLTIQFFGFDIGPWQDFATTAVTTVAGLWAAFLAIRAGQATKPLGGGSKPS